MRVDGPGAAPGGCGTSVRPSRTGARILILTAVLLAAACRTAALAAEPTLEAPQLGTWRKQCVAVIGAYDDDAWKVLLTGEHDVEKWVPIPRSEVALDGCTHPRNTPATLTAPPSQQPGTARKEQTP